MFLAYSNHPLLRVPPPTSSSLCLLFPTPTLLFVQGEQINTNMNQLSEVNERLFTMNNIRMRKPRTDEVGHAQYALQYVAVRCRVCCSVLQCVAMNNVRMRKPQTDTVSRMCVCVCVLSVSVSVCAHTAAWVYTHAHIHTYTHTHTSTHTHTRAHTHTHTHTYIHTHTHTHTAGPAHLQRV